ESVEGEDRVLGRDRLAVVKFCFRAQPVGGRGEIVRIADGFGEQAVFGGNLVQALHQESLVDEVDADRQCAFHAGDCSVEIVVGAKRDLPRRAAFRRVGTDVVELLEAGRIFEVAEQRKAVPPDPLLRLRGICPRGKRQPPGGEREQGGREQGSAIHEELQYGLRAASSRCRAPAISRGDYVFFNCGASMPARGATKWTSHPRGSAGSDGVNGLL